MYLERERDTTVSHRHRHHAATVVAIFYIEYLLLLVIMYWLSSAARWHRRRRRRCSLDAVGHFQALGLLRAARTCGRGFELHVPLANQFELGLCGRG